jgi:hypothetical protein
MKLTPHDLDCLPGGDLVRKGLEDLHGGRISEHSLLVLLARTRLTALGLAIPEPPEPPLGRVSHALYDHLADCYGDDAYSRYNSLLRRMASFVHALEQQET